MRRKLRYFDTKYNNDIYDDPMISGSYMSVIYKQIDREVLRKHNIFTKGSQKIQKDCLYIVVICRNYGFYNDSFIMLVNINDYS